MKSNNLNNRPFFSSKNLNQAFESVVEIFENHQEDINSVSSDIRSLEEYIKSKNVQVSFQEDYEKSDSNYKYYLKWDKLSNESKEFRLICEVAHYDFIEQIWVLSNEPKPLIEQSLAVRMAVYPHLAHFMGALANKIKIFTRTPAPAEATESEIPF